MSTLIFKKTDWQSMPSQSMNNSPSQSMDNSFFLFFSLSLLLSLFLLSL